MTTPSSTSNLVAAGTTSTDLNLLVEPLKREIAVPGEFALNFPNTADFDLVGSLGQGFAEAQLDGFFAQQVLDPYLNTVTPVLTVAGGQMVLIYTAITIIRARLRSLQTSTKYKAGPVEYDVSQSANVLTSELKSFDDRKKFFISQALRAQRSKQTVYISDGYLVRAQSYEGNLAIGLHNEFGFGLAGYELVGFGTFFAIAPGY